MSEQLLEPTGVTFLVPAIKKFATAENFVTNTSPTARVRILVMGKNFRAWFGGKVECDLDEVTLKLSKLRERSADQPIMDELEECCEISLYGFYETLAQKQARNDLSWTIGYVDDVDCVRRVVDAYWYDGGWDVYAYAVGNPNRWLAGLGVVSR